MAASPVHKLGQIIGDFIEQYFENELKQICNERGLYLDVVGKKRAARKGSKVSWQDIYGNKHDLDFVIERNGTDEKIGIPVALIESAWRRYTKHSKNKAQEIQGAVLPIAENYKYHKPFLGAILAGVYSEPSILQLNSCGFKTIYFKYEHVMAAFAKVGIDIEYDEKTTDEVAQQKVLALESLTSAQYQQAFNIVVQLNTREIDKFKKDLIYSLDRQMEAIVIAPLYGVNISFETIDDAIIYLNTFAPENLPTNAELIKIFVQVRFSNGDCISGDFVSSVTATTFLQVLTI